MNIGRSHPKSPWNEGLSAFLARTSRPDHTIRRVCRSLVPQPGKLSWGGRSVRQTECPRHRSASDALQESPSSAPLLHGRDSGFDPHDRATRGVIRFGRGLRPHRNPRRGRSLRVPILVADRTPRADNGPGTRSANRRGVAQCRLTRQATRRMRPLATARSTSPERAA
jgi:hypothetical protein